MHPHTHSWFGTKLNTPNPSVFYMYWGSWFLRPNKQIQILTCNSLNTQPLKYDLSTLFLNFIIQCISYSPQPWWAANLRILLPPSSSKSLISTCKGPGSSCVENSICAATGLKACALRTWTTPHSRSPLWRMLCIVPWRLHVLVSFLILSAEHAGHLDQVLSSLLTALWMHKPIFPWCMSRTVMLSSVMGKQVSLCTPSWDPGLPWHSPRS